MPVAHRLAMPEMLGKEKKGNGSKLLVDQYALEQEWSLRHANYSRIGKVLGRPGSAATGDKK